MPWIMEEEALLKDKLAGVKVTDQKAPPAGRDVQVWFRFPEMELRDIIYPFITIDLVGIGEALDRAQRGGQGRPTVNGYRPPDMVSEPEGGKIWISDWPVAMNLTYQITTWSRSAQHDRQMTPQIWAKFPGRYGFLGGNAAPYVRPFSAQLQGYQPGHRIDEFGKRQFRGIFTLQVFSELWASEIRAVTPLSDIDISLKVDTPPGEWLSDITCYE